MSATPPEDHDQPGPGLSGLVSLNLRVHPELRRRLKIAAAEQDITVRELVTDVLDAYMTLNGNDWPPTPDVV